MAYCDKCGAYIPDGQSKCLACGYDEKEEQAKAQAQAQAKQYQSSDAFQREEKIRAQAEKRRSEQQEQYRKWAEEEKQRREQQEQYKKWAAEEKARRDEEEARRAAENRQEDAAPDLADLSADISLERILGVLSYINLLFLVPMIFFPDNRFANFHAKQGLRLFITSMIANIVGGIFSIRFVLNIFMLLFAIKGISNAWKGLMVPLPYIGTDKK